MAVPDGGVRLRPGPGAVPGRLLRALLRVLLLLLPEEKRRQSDKCRGIEEEGQRQDGRGDPVRLLGIWGFDECFFKKKYLPDALLHLL